MKIFKIIKVVSIVLIAGVVVSASAYAQSVDVTTNVVKQPEAPGHIPSVMNQNYSLILNAVSHQNLPVLLNKDKDEDEYHDDWEDC
jgi:hypothetical protein